MGKASPRQMVCIVNCCRYLRRLSLVIQEYDDGDLKILFIVIHHAGILAT